MKFNEVYLNDFQNYDEETIDFPDGVTLIRGKNGAGKSTLLRAIFGGLFLSDMTSAAESVTNLDDLVRKGEDEAIVKLSFEVGDEDYELTWAIKASYDDDGERSAKTNSNKTKLESSAFEEAISGVEATVDEIESLLGMDAETFVSSVYVQQDDLTRLATADADERARIIDRLLGLKKVEDYIDRMKTARPAASAAADEAENRQEEVREQLEDFRDLSELKSEKRSLSQEIASLESDIDEYENKLDGYEDKRDELDERISEKSDKIKEIEELENKLESKKEKRNKIQEEVQELVSEISDKKEKLETVADQLQSAQDSIDEYDVSDETVAKESLSEVRDKISDEKDAKEELATEKATAEAELDSLESKATDTADELGDVKDELTEVREKHEEKTEQVSGLKGDLDEKKDELFKEYADAIGSDDEELTEGEVSKEETRERIQSLAYEREDASNSDFLDELRTEFNQNLNTVLPLFDEVEELRAEKRVEEARVSRFEERISTLESEEEELQNEIEELESEIEEQQGIVSEYGSKLSEREDTIEELESSEQSLSIVVDAYSEKDSLESEISNLQSKVGEKNERISDIKDHISQLSEQKEDVEDELVDMDVDELKDKRETAKKLVQKMEEKISEAKEELQEKRDTRTRIEERIKGREKLENKIDELEERRKWANKRYDELNAAIEAYEDARLELRRENIAILNGYVNDLFKELYKNRSFDEVQIDENYGIKLIRNDGETIEPELSSGGEGAILNIALRAGVYKLVTERSTNGGEHLPPFILDEPTTFLDSSHVGQLDGLMQKMRDWDVEQVLVVSHEESLIDGADNEIRVIKDDRDLSHATTNPDTENE